MTITVNGDYYHWLVEHAPDIISVFELDGSIRFKNPAVERALGYTPEEMIGRNEGSVARIIFGRKRSSSD